MGVFDFRRFGAAERAVWPVGHAGTAAPSGWILGPELALTSRYGDRLRVPTYEGRHRAPPVDREAAKGHERSELLHAGA
eukprot:419390-Alexandrium_andersonii.AAC.1